MKKWLLTALVFTSVGHAGEFIVYGSGAMSCERWTQARDTDVEWYQHSQWLQGYLVGRADMGAGMRGTDQEKINLWVDEYCSQNPLHDVLDAARAQALELEATAQH